MEEEKRRMRAGVRRAERALSPEYKAASDRAIAANVLGMAEYQAASCVFCFVGAEREIDTRPILEDVLRRGKVLCVPLCTGEGIMEARVIRSLAQLREGAYGLLEPPAGSPAVPRDRLGFSVVPCVSCDAAGGRLGQGGGYYDRFFAPGTERSVVICRRRLMRPLIPRGPHDLAFPAVATEEGVFSTGS